MPLSSLRIAPLPLLLLSVLLPPPAVVPLQCYQTQHSLTASLQGNALSCPSSSFSCTKSTDFNMQIMARACQSSNCTFPNGTTSAAPICFNSSSNAQSYCCCYGDSCNGMTKEWGSNGQMPLMILLMSVGTMAALGVVHKI